MARYQYVILGQAVQGREDEFDAWYDNQHLGDVARIRGVVSARRFNVEWQKTTELEAPHWRSLAIYEIEADDPRAVVAAISAASGTEAMPISDAMTKSGLVQVLGGPAKPR
jgi:hypothetical protein